MACLETINVEAEQRWAARLQVDRSLTRALVSFQANKDQAVHRWFKFKEAFSAALVEQLLDRCQIHEGTLLDPFAGSGTSLFAASNMGIDAVGIEVLPIGQAIIAAKQLIENGLDGDDIERLERWAAQRPWKTGVHVKAVPELRITRGAFPTETREAIGRFLGELDLESGSARTILFFALLCVLESVSYTRKDGQYLRWDARSGRRAGKKNFSKGQIASFDEAMVHKLREIISDLHRLHVPRDLFAPPRRTAGITLHAGSCLKVLPSLASNSFDAVMTSPPYCNRYDYTRTYALELALLGVDETGLTALRQEMLSCTVENRSKNLAAMNPAWTTAVEIADRHPLLQNVLEYLDAQKQSKLLNNNGIPRMVRGYFYEMACVILELARVLKKDAPLIMVNDNVRYAGMSVAVDIILSEMAEELGFRAERILVLPNGKGNSSQQMGAHGREALRKCVYF